jgi:hypothetical protein
MGHKNQAPIVLNFQSADPRTGFLPLNNKTANIGSIPSGVASGTMTGAAVLYSQILDVSRMDSLGLELDWTGTPTGTLALLASVSGASWADVTALFTTPAITNPAGGASTTLGGYKQYEYKYFLMKYTNASGAGSLTGYLQVKDLN